MGVELLLKISSERKTAISSASEPSLRYWRESSLKHGVVFHLLLRKESRIFTRVYGHTPLSAVLLQEQFQLPKVNLGLKTLNGTFQEQTVGPLEIEPRSE